MKIALLSTYPPRKCGIATFCNNMEKNIRSFLNQEDQIGLFAMTPDQNTLSYPPNVVQLIKRNDPTDYRKAGKSINTNYDVCIVQFEHGIYGGNDGIFLLMLLSELKIPVISILHTVLENPSFHQRIVVERIAHYSSKIVVMNEMAIGFLSHSYGVNSSKIAVIEHGVPDYKNHNPKSHKNDFGWKQKHILMTFGLISSGKGYEYAIKALPEVLKKHPDTLFVIIGQTHPNTLKQEGEKYRDELKLLIKQLHLHDYVLFIDRHVSEQELMDYLSVADLYICPYLNEAQITSGTLSYALGSGAAILATPFWHSIMLCKRGYVINFPFKDDRQLSQQITSILSDPVRLSQLQSKTKTYGSALSWPKIAGRYLKLIDEVYYDSDKKIDDVKIYPAIDFTYLRKLSNEKGMMQHAGYTKINLEEGYCLDDNARALLCLLKEKQRFDEKQNDLIDIYFNFIEQSQTSFGKFLNFATYPDLNFKSYYSEDAVGRTSWVLCLIVSMPQMKVFHQRAQKLIDKNTPYIAKIKSIRGTANSLIAYALLKDVNTVNHLAERMIDYHNSFKTKEWNWFENQLTYDNGILPLSLLYAYEFTKNQKYLKTALQTLQFLNTVHFKQGYLSLVGNEHWYVRHENCSVFSQQPIDAMASVLVNSKAYEITRESQFRKLAIQSMDWFYGENIRNAPLYDSMTKACHDGLNDKGITKNQGAESIIAYLLARIEIEKLIV